MTGLTTRILHADRLGGSEHDAVHKPLHVAATYAYPDAKTLAAVFQGRQSGYVYSRQGNPTGASLEAKITMMEQGRGSVVFTTGMSAISSTMIALLRRGDHVVSSQFLFGNTSSLFHTLVGIGVDISFVDVTDLNAVAGALRPETRMVFAETIANPRTQVADLVGIGALCDERGVLFVMDGTLTTPELIRGRDVQASLVVHALTKAIGGHGNALGGSVTDTGLYNWTRYPNIAESYRNLDPKAWGLQQIRKKGLRDLGATLRAEDAHRIAAGAETLSLRIERTCANALALAQWLEQQPQIDRVHYPGLASHPQHARATQLFGKRYGSLLSFELRAEIDCFAFLDALKLVILSSHLSDNRTLAIPVAHTIFYEMGAQRRAEMGIAEGLIRLSVGIEDLADLQEDLGQALASCS
ncbi:MAG: cystathionine gamma-synthase family protein [Burkholderiales bacterium]|jgi:O-acetylhomoserine (thiol)-lyase